MCCWLRVCVVLLVGGSLAMGAVEGERPLWGPLEPGPYRVGFRAVFLKDNSRVSVMPGSRAPGREMQISLWYPADSTRASKPFTYGRYVELLAQSTDFRSLDAERRKLAQKMFMDEPAELGGDRDDLAAKLPELMQLATAACEECPESAGRFPLVVFPEYRAPATNSILSEYLASHGCVVGTVGLKGSTEVDYDTGLSGLDTTATDMGFVVAALSTLPYVDSDRVALIGLGISGSSALAYQMKNPSIDAVVSLDGGITTEFENRIISRTSHYDRASVDVPLLFITAPHSALNRSLIDQYAYSKRYIAHFPKMSEFLFLDYGMLQSRVPRIIGTASADAQVGFVWASHYVLNFLNAHLKGDPDAAQFLARRPEENSVPAGVLEYETKAALSPAPTLPRLKAVIRDNGIAALVSWFNELQKSDPQPVSQDKFGELFMWLSNKRDADWSIRKSLAELRLRSFPASARTQFTAAHAFLQVGDVGRAEEHFKRTLDLLPLDLDPALPHELRVSMEQSCRTQLAKMAGQRKQKPELSLSK